MSDALILAALDAGVLIVDPITGTINGTRWNKTRNRGTVNLRGYRVFTLHFDGKRCQAKAHRTVWLSVHRIIPEGMVIDHINRRKSDNRLANLRLADAMLNAQNRRSYAGVENWSAKINNKIAEAIRALYAETHSYAKVAKKFEVSKSLVAKIIRGELWN